MIQELSSQELAELIWEGKGKMILKMQSKKPKPNKNTQNFTTHIFFLSIILSLKWDHSDIGKQDWHSITVDKHKQKDRYSKSEHKIEWNIKKLSRIW